MFLENISPTHKFGGYFLSMQIGKGNARFAPSIFWIEAIFLFMIPLKT
ncbi:hypothetical protein MNB_SUP05-SYMBIONT-5-241 [hydrothermal vent metagenome]|uniref:Uncharacterized protein n=1 Tax=hydrothermal vent metagenome TaxID=652676 RepID=A0A1W1E2G6_9ZZZZ